MSKAKEPEDNSKQYGLTDLEKRMITVMSNRHQEEFSNFLTYICLGRLSVSITPNTKLTINEQKMLVVTEVEPEPEQPQEEVSVA